MNDKEKLIEKLETWINNLEGTIKGMKKELDNIDSMSKDDIFYSLGEMNVSPCKHCEDQVDLCADKEHLKTPGMQAYMTNKMSAKLAPMKTFWNDIADKELDFQCPYYPNFLHWYHN